MHNKQVRRRRAVLAALLLVSLALLTAYFGQAAGGPLGQIQRGIGEVLSPVQAGASKVLSPVSDLAGWVSSTLHAKSRNAQLLRENRRLQDELAYAQQEALEYRQAAQNTGLDVKLGISSAQRVDAAVISQDPSVWYQTIEINRGSDDGIAVNNPVVGDGALVGKVTTVGPNYSFVTLITDHTYSVAAEVQEPQPQSHTIVADRGMLVAQVGDPEQLLLEYLNPHAPIAPGDEVVTTGFTDPSDPSLVDLFPAGIPIGYVASFNANELLNNDEVPVTPTADIMHLQNVQVLIHVNGATQLAAVRASARAGTG